MQNTRIHTYVALICVSAVLLSAIQQWSSLASWTLRDVGGFATLVLLGLAAEQQAWTVRVGRTAGGSSIAFLPLLTIVLLYGPAAGVLFWLISGPIAEYGIRRKPPLKANFNVGQYVASTAVAGFAYQTTGGVALMSVPDSLRSGMLLQQVAPFVVFSVVFLVLNNGAVATAIALSQNLSLRRTWRELVGTSGSNLLLDLLIAPVAIAVAALYIQIGIVGVLLSILPLLFIRYSYQTQQNLKLANNDLLKALVKAIETRDPYTSGHSLRVSYLAKRIAERLGLRQSLVETIETAALLHDIGKIEAVYTEILGKPDSLSPEERAVIESHVIRGEELLRNLASVPDDVVRAVRHHHEREDGTGYPDGLRGDAIPLAAKIIVVCDAIDAMLSDRPYRQALPLPAVRQQLTLHAGTQFDSRLVQLLLSSSILEEYAAMMAKVRRGNAEVVELGESRLWRAPVTRQSALSGA